MPRFPSIRSVAAELRSVNQTKWNPKDPEDQIDVRLQVYPDGAWAIRSGDSQYDTDHRGYWGAASVPGNRRRFRSEDVARDLLDQARDHAADDTDGDS